MKKILAMAAVAALAAGASAYAANPFSDVSTSDWAYQAISDLSDRGLVDGYPDGTFKGQQNITRYEVAQIVARLMAKEDQMNAENRAIVDRLASEYSAELQNLGVRVGNLEKKVGNIAWSGDARVRFQKANGEGGSDKFNGRMRINVRATVNDTTYVHGRIVGNADFKNGDDATAKLDRLYVHHQFGKVGATLGRYELDLGQQAGGWLYANAFDGIEVAAPLGEKVNLAVGYGRMKDASGNVGPDKAHTETVGNYTVKGTTLTSNFNKAEAVYAKLGADFKVAKVGLEYIRVSPFSYKANVAELYKGATTEGDPVAKDVTYSTESVKKSIWGVNLFVPVNKFRVFGDYYADTQENIVLAGGKDVIAKQKGKIWTVGIGYGEKNLQKAGSFNLDLAYYKVKAGLYQQGMTGLQLPTADSLLGIDGHFWLATGDVVLAKNTYLHGEYAFAAKQDDNAKGNAFNDTYGSSWTLSLNYKF